MNEIILQYILFFAACVFSFYIPGKILISSMKLNLSVAHIFILNWTFGIAFFILTTYSLALLRMDFLTLVILLIFSIIYLFKHRKYSNIKSTNTFDKTSVIIIVVGSISFLLVMFFSGWKTSDGIQYIGINAFDGIRHISYIKNQTIFFPPQHPGLTGEELRGFHYFYDFMLSRFMIFFNFSADDLSFRLFPLLISLIYGAGFYILTSSMTKKSIQIRWVLLFAYFSQSSIFLLYLFNQKINIAANAVVQPIGLIINPFTVLSIGMLLVGLSLIPQIKHSWRYAVLTGVILGVLSQMKVYSGLIAIACIIIYPIYLLIKTKKIKLMKNYFIVAFVAAFITAATYLPNNYNSGGLIFMPLLFYSHFMQGPLMEGTHWEIRRIIFAENNNIIRIILLYAEAVALFFLINLGTRLIVLTKTRTLLTKKFWNKEYNFLLFISIMFPTLIFSFFIQPISVFDVVQFFWIALAILSIPSGLVVGHLWLQSSIKYKSFILLLLISFSAPGFFQFLNYHIFPKSPIKTTNEDLQIYNAVSIFVPKDKYFIYLPPEEYMDPSKEFSHSGTLNISAFSGRSVYAEPGGIPSRFDSEYQNRIKKLYKLHSAIQACENDAIIGSLIEINSRQILTANNYPCMATNSALLKRIESNHLKYYEFR